MSERKSYEKFVSKYAHETPEYAGKKAHEITERIVPFQESDLGKRAIMPKCNWMLPKEVSFEEYKKELEPVFWLEKVDDGIIIARAHTGDGGLIWGTTAHAYVHKLFEYVGQDRDAEILIFGSSGNNFFEGLGPNPYYSEPENFIPMSEFDPKTNWQLFDHQYYDGTHDIEAEVWNCGIPTIGIWHGGSFHSDLFLLCDITLATEDAWTKEQHFCLNMFPGDGVQVAWRALMGRKRFAYAELTGQIITARMALEWGMINEILPDLESAYDRALEIARLIVRSATRQTRRLTTQILRKPWKEDYANELHLSFATEMYTTLSEGSPHDQLYWETAKSEAAAVLAAEKKGKVIKPRIGPYIEEDPIK